MDRSDWVAWAFVVLVVGSGMAGVGGGTQEGVFISDVSTTPTEPTVGESVELTATLVNPTVAGFEVSSVTLETADGSRTLAFEERDQTISSESDGTVSISRSFDDPGERSLTVVVRGTLNGISVVREQTVTVSVDTVGRPSVAVAADDAIAGEETTVSVTLSNGRTEQLRNVRVSIAGESIQTNRTRYVRPSIEAGRTETFQFGVTPTTPGSRVVTAVVEYVTDGGVRERLVRNLTLETEPARRTVELSAQVGDGARPPVEATLTNLGNVPTSDTVVAVVSNGTVVGRATLSDVQPGASETVSINVSNATGPVTVRANYTAADERQTTETTVTYRSNPAVIDLTGLEFERDGGTIQVSGSASNLGMAPATGVLVEVASEPGVRPVGPNPEFFVGRVDASDFVSFELTLELAANRTTVPISVTWLDDGRRERAQATLDVGSAATPAPASSGGPSDDTLLVGAGVVGLAVVAVMGYGLYNSLS